MELTLGVLLLVNAGKPTPGVTDPFLVKLGPFFRQMRANGY